MLLILYTKNLEFRLEIIFIRSFILIEDLAGFVVLSTEAHIHLLQLIYLLYPTLLPFTEWSGC